MTTHLKAHIFHFKKWTRLLLSGLSLTLVNSAAAIEFSMNGDMRASLFSLHRDDRDGKETATHEIRVRPGSGLAQNSISNGECKYVLRDAIPHRR